MTDPAFILDSNICIYILNGATLPLRQRLEGHRPGQVVVSTISHAEVMHGIPTEDRERTQRAERLFTYFPALPFDLAASRAYRGIPFRRGTFDRLIAAHALALNLTLITNNERDFADVPELRVENWTK